MTRRAAATDVPPPRLVATDLDGTLLRADGSVSPWTGAVLAALEESGVDVVFVTARPPRWVDDLVDAVGGHGVVLCLNGAFVYDARTRRVVERTCVVDDVVREVVADLRRALPSVAFAVERVTGMAHEQGFADLEHLFPPEGPVARRIEDLVDGSTGKLLARCPDVDDDALVGLVAEVLGDRAVVADSGARGLAEISAAGVTKGAALARWTASRGVDRADVWAFGDMPNDLPMLTWAGRAFAVRDAHPDVLAAAHEVCASNEDDGVARRLAVLLDESPTVPGRPTDGGTRPVRHG